MNCFIEIPTFSFKKMHLKISSAKWRPFCRVLNVLTKTYETIATLTSAKQIGLSFWRGVRYGWDTCLAPGHLQPSLRNSSSSYIGPYVMSPFRHHYTDVIMDAIASQITSLTIVYSSVYSDVDQRKHQSSASLPFVGGIHREPVNSPHKWPVVRKMFPFDDFIMTFLVSYGR